MKKGEREMYRPLLKQSGQLNLMTGALLIFLGLLPPSHLLRLHRGQGGKGPDDWKFTAAPYLMIPWMNGTAAVRGREVDVDVGAGDIFSHLQFGVMGSFEARKARWGTYLDAVYMALAHTRKRKPGLPLMLISIRGRIHSLPAPAERESGSCFRRALERLQGKLEFKGPLLTGTYEQTKQWVNPIVGFQLKHPRRPAAFRHRGGHRRFWRPVRTSPGTCFRSSALMLASVPRSGSDIGF